MLRLLRLVPTKARAFAGQRRRIVAQHVAARTFDLDDVGAHVTQQGCGIRTRQIGAQVEHCDARQSLKRHGYAGCLLLTSMMRCARSTIGRSTSLPSSRVAAAPVSRTAAKASSTRTECAISCADGENAALNTAIWFGWIDGVPVNPSARASCAMARNASRSFSSTMRAPGQAPAGQAMGMRAHRDVAGR